MNWRSKLILDNWAHFSFKPKFDDNQAPEGAWLAPQWVGKEDRRRLAAYTMLRAYQSNVARWYLGATDAYEFEEREARHEYGDAALLVQSISSAVLGDSVEIGAPDQTEVPDVYMDWAREWAKKVRAVRKLTTTEDHCVGEGDGILVVGWDSKAGRPSLTPYDPGFYFPELTDFTEEYPEAVHIAWSVPPDDDIQRERVRRITYRLVPLDDPRVAGGPSDPDLVSDDTNQGDYPWNGARSNVTCLMSDGTWELTDSPDVKDLTEDTATWETNADGNPVHNLDLGIDFIPVIHIPNTPADEEHFGVSSLATVLQLLDELSNVYTDLSKGAAIAGFPPLASEGGALATGKDGTVASYGPGTVFNGKLTSIDTSSGLTVLMDYVLFLLKHLNTNSRVPEVLLGRVDPSNVPSGVALRLMFTQMKMMIGRMHLVREEKYPLIFKFAARFAMANGALPATTDWPEITFIPGQFVPSDLETGITAVVAAYSAKIISLETAITMMIDLGCPIESVEDEIEAIQSRDFGSAAALGLAVEDVGAAAEFLGRPRPNLPEPAPDTDQVE